MLNLVEIQNTIKELENSETTFANCQKLASLYIVQRFYSPQDTEQIEEVSTEIDDILPAYQQYCEVKRQFQLQRLPDTSVIQAMKNVCAELRDLVMVIYSNSDMENERQQLKNLLIDLTTELVADK